MNERIVVSGVGILSPNGVDKDAFRDGLHGGKSGIRRLTRLDCAVLQTKVAGFIDDAVIDSLFQDRESSARLDRTTVLALIAAQRAAADARLQEDSGDPSRKGIFLGTACGPVQSLEETCARFYRDKEPYFQPSLVPRTQFQTAVRELAARHALAQAAVTVSCSAASSLMALANARDHIRAGHADTLLVGGVDCPIAPCHYRMWDSLRLLTRDGADQPGGASRPFDRRRSGMVLAEGCGFVVVERESVALARNAEIYAEVLGAGYAFDNAPDPFPRMETMAGAFENALRDAGCAPADIQHIQADASGSPGGDAAEARAIARLFGTRTRSLPVSAVKSMVGNTLGASGLIALVAALLGMRNGFIAPTINLQEPDPDCALDHVANEARELDHHTALVHACAIGGGPSVAVVVRKC